MGIVRCDASAPAAGPGPSAGSVPPAEATTWSRWNGHCSTLRLQVLETTDFFSPHPARGRIERLRVDLGPSSGIGPQQSVDLEPDELPLERQLRVAADRQLDPAQPRRERVADELDRLLVDVRVGHRVGGPAPRACAAGCGTRARPPAPRAGAVR